MPEILMSKAYTERISCSKENKLALLNDCLIKLQERKPEFRDFNTTYNFMLGILIKDFCNDTTIVRLSPENVRLLNNEVLREYIRNTKHKTPSLNQRINRALVYYQR